MHSYVTSCRRERFEIYHRVSLDMVSGSARTKIRNLALRLEARRFHLPLVPRALIADICT